jgi:hypothetical protein
MKTIRRSFSQLANALLATIFLLAAPAALWGQQLENPGLISVRLVDVRSGAEAEFEAAIAEVAAASQAAGRPYFHVFQTIRGSNLPSYSIITADGAFNDLPPLDIDASVFDRIGHSLNGNQLMTVNIAQALSIIPPSGVAPSGDFMYVRVRRTTPSNQQAYFDWHENQLTAALRDAGAADVRAGRVIMGGNTNTFVRFYYGDTFRSAPTGGVNLAESMGERDFGRMLDAEADLTVASEDYVYRFRADLSFTAGQ